MVVTEETYKHNEKEHNTNAAAEIVPFLMGIFQPKSVLDIGCGIGTWLYEFKKSGVPNVLGIDIPYVDKNLLSKYLKENEFQVTDLSKPFNLEKKFDLAISLEVAEHLPENAAHSFVHSIIQHTDIMVFSAAVPFQEGQNHINEQWPEYWEEIFNSEGYIAYDFIRDEFWDNEKIDIWYRQNIILYAKPGLVELQHFEPAKGRLSKIHPSLYVSRMKKLKHTQIKLKKITTKPAVKTALHVLVRSVAKWFD
jgi:SAM-dependent methyltransferase